MKSLPFVLMWVLALACQSEDVVPLRADFVVAARAADFSEVVVGQTVAFELAVENTGSTALTIETKVQGPAVFAVEPQSLSLDLGQRQHMVVSFAPSAAQAYSGGLHIFDALDPQLSVDVVLSGRGTMPSCDDNNSCTEDRLDLSTGHCRHLPRQGSCDDGIRCTNQDSCVDGVCIGRATVCDDGIACTVDVCDETQGCVALPQHQLCGDEDPCSEDLCDPELGCHNPVAPNGTLCGPVDCALMWVCLNGQCLDGPTPDGFFCDDGNPCTTGDTCQGGQCLAGQGQLEQTGITEPVDLDLRITANNLHGQPEPANPVAVLAIHEVQGDNYDLEMIWVNRANWQQAGLQVMRTRFRANGVVVTTEFLLSAIEAKAAYHQNRLHLLTMGCQDCCERFGCDPGPCSPRLFSYPDHGGPVSFCMYDTDSLEMALAADANQASVAVLKRNIGDDGDFYSVKLQHFATDSSNPAATVYATEPQLGEQQPRGLALGSHQGSMEMVLQRHSRLHGDWICDGSPPDPWSALLVSELQQTEPTISRLANLSGGIKLASGLPGSGVLWRTEVDVDSDQQCIPYKGLLSFKRTPAGEIFYSTLARYDPEGFDYVHALALMGEPTALVHFAGGALRVINQPSQSAQPLVVDVPAPVAAWTAERRVFAWFNLQGPYGLSTSATTEGGAIVAAITAPEGLLNQQGKVGTQRLLPNQELAFGIAYFRIGCGE